ncbi:hypothetical protein TorRG33x02_350510 [Trema orientale]|uniref:Uncharacterized protein n=1 Tax=Trema orientale TaxID=63057 RepID=A0A2P5AH95_TREOI|nr:hypothetical protein TorRG33x02_350510 [Trema orientale]
MTDLRLSPNLGSSSADHFQCRQLFFFVWKLIVVGGPRIFIDRCSILVNEPSIYNGGSSIFVDLHA